MLGLVKSGWGAEVKKHLTGRLCSRQFKGERGMSLIEVVITAAIIYLALVPMLNSFVLGWRYGEESRRRLTALHLAQGKLEELKDRPYAAVVNEPAFPDFSDPGKSVPFPGQAGYSYQVATGAEGQYNNTEISLAVFYTDAGTPKNIVITMEKVKR